MMKENENTYQSIDCGFYDEIEIAIMRGVEVEMEYVNAEGESIVTSLLLKDTLTEDKAEFVILSDDSRIRMDKIVRLGYKFADRDSCKINKATV